MERRSIGVLGILWYWVGKATAADAVFVPSIASLTVSELRILLPLHWSLVPIPVGCVRFLLSIHRVLAIMGGVRIMAPTSPPITLVIVLVDVLVLIELELHEMHETRVD